MAGECKKIFLDGAHLMLDCFECNSSALSDEEGIKGFLAMLPGELGMKKLIDPFLVSYAGGDTWDKGGITAFMLIAESHISIHTFPHDGFFTADVYSCKPFDTKKAVRLFRKQFGFRKEKINVARREIEFLREKNLLSVMNKA